MRGFQRHLRRDNHGLSLLETLIATVIVSFLAIEVANIFARGRVAITEEGRKRTATQLAQGELERIETQPASLIVAGERDLVVAGRTYHLRTSVTPGSPVAGMSAVLVRVDWTTRSGVGRSVRLEAACSDPR